ncbi:MAG: 30S ribosomal protein S2 [Planctomycetes bacterium]|nr:30S ribosomal protein S2 [Planctomycetota bacterium]MCB9909462.1 30S ribosomal protein S2 [Planctomycetota bacterium]HPF13851.1 30S ribosomal protein S2 [Planctomycetota bacterium]HRV81864.1 30S ribosomal protein S2 [Planctomycetota bacterium]
MEQLTVQQLVEAGVHFGCRASRWNPKMAPFIHGRRNKIHVIDLRQTMRGLIRAQNLLFRLASEGQSVLWVGTKRQVKGVVLDAGERTGMPIVTERWIGGTLTNFSVIRSRLRRLEELENIDEAKADELKLTKKELSTINRERRKIARNLGGIREMTAIPAAMMVVDPSREGNAIREARKMGLVVIGILDTDCDPSDVDIVIPGNDDALKSVRLLMDQLVAAVEEGAHQHTDRLRAAGVPQAQDEALVATGEPRPTTHRELPKRRADAAPADAASAEAASADGSDAAPEEAPASEA